MVNFTNVLAYLLELVGDFVIDPTMVVFDVSDVTVNLILQSTLQNYHGLYFAYRVMAG